jgi:hypothetical protein
MMYNHNVRKLQDMVKEKQVAKLGSHTTSSTTSHDSVYGMVSSLKAREA